MPLNLVTRFHAPGIGSGQFLYMQERIEALFHPIPPPALSSMQHRRGGNHPCAAPTDTSCVKHPAAEEKREPTMPSLPIQATLSTLWEQRVEAPSHLSHWLSSVPCVESGRVAKPLHVADQCLGSSQNRTGEVKPKKTEYIENETITQ